MLNEDKEVSDAYRARIGRAMEVVRVVVAAAAAHGDQVIGPLYTELGTRFHNQGLLKAPERLRATVEEALESAGLDRALAAEMRSTRWDADVRRSHTEGITLVGQDVGTPIIRVGANAFFGPVITATPKGEEAGRLWDAVVAVTSFEDFFELKRSRTRDIRFD
nr:disulfide bond formation protein DsbA [Nonomuraea antri]